MSSFFVNIEYSRGYIFTALLVEMAYKFLYGDESNITRIMQWIEHKIDATVAKNRGVVSHALEGLNPRETDMHPAHFAIYSRDVEASVHFALDKATGEITVSFESEAYGKKGGNPWWCLAGPRTCSKIATADSPYDISILEYIQHNILVRTSPTRMTRRRLTGRSRSGSGSRSGSSSSSSSRRKNRSK